MRAVVLLLLWPALAGAADIHLSPAGSDTTGTGSLAAPYRSLGFVLDPAAERVQEGDRLVLHAPPGNAVYRETEVRLRRRLTLIAAAGETPRIECPLELQDGVCVQIDPSASGSVLSGLDISGGNLYGVFLQTDWDARSAPSGRGAENVLIENCKVHDTGRDAIKVTPRSNGLTIRNCEIYNSGRIYPPGTPLEDRNAEGIDNVGGNGMKVQDCHVHDISTTGIYFKGGASDVLIERNRVERTGEGGILIGFDTSPEFFDVVVNPQYFEAERAIVRNNIVRDTDYAGIGLYASRGAQVSHNTVINGGRIGHAGLYFGVTLQDFDPIAGRPANRDNLIRNNVIAQSGTGRFECAAIRYSQDLGGLSGLQGAAGLSGNLYFRSGAPCVFRDGRPGSALNDGGGLANWQQALGSDLGSVELDPLLASDGRLRAGGPAIDRAAAPALVSEDFEREPRDLRPDLGADELVSGSVAADRVISGALSGSWFDPARSGEGFVLEIGADGAERSLIASWYTYENGEQMWLFGSAALSPGSRSVRVPMLRTRGARFGADFRAQDVQASAWGVVEFRFPDCQSLDLRYEPVSGAAGTLRLRRILGAIEGLTCSP